MAAGTWQRFSYMEVGGTFS